MLTDPRFRVEREWYLNLVFIQSPVWTVSAEKWHNDWFPFSGNFQTVLEYIRLNWVISSDFWVGFLQFRGNLYFDGRGLVFNCDAQIYLLQKRWVLRRKLGWREVHEMFMDKRSIEYKRCDQIRNMGIPIVLNNWGRRFPSYNKWADGCGLRITGPCARFYKG